MTSIVADLVFSCSVGSGRQAAFIFDAAPHSGNEAQGRNGPKGGILQPHHQQTHTRCPSGRCSVERARTAGFEGGLSRFHPCISVD